MTISITEEFIRTKLREAIESAPSSDGYAEIDLTDETRLKCAAVLIPLLWQDDEWHLLFTRRTDKVESHKGQVSFPGGACDEGETTPEETALREANEEIGIDPHKVRVLGKIMNMITITSFRVTPVVGIIEWPAVLHVGKDEVERVFIDPTQLACRKKQSLGIQHARKESFADRISSIRWRIVWGATARMTVDFLKVLDL